MRASDMSRYSTNEDGTSAAEAVDALAQELARTDCVLGVVDGKLVLALEQQGRTCAVVLSDREADRLAGRLRKHASDLRASKARQGQGATHGDALNEARRV